MNQDLVNAEISSTDLAEINTAAETIKSKIPFSVSLTNDDRISLLKLGDSFRPAVDKAVNVVTEHPEIMPGTFDVLSFKKDYNLVKTLEPVSQKIHTILQAIDDTILAAGSDTLTAMLEVYSEIKSHKDKIPGLNAVYNEMKPYFAKKRNAVNQANTQTQQVSN